MLHRCIGISVAVVLSTGAPWAAQAQDVTLVSTVALKAPLAELVPAFEKTHGPIATRFAGAAALKKEIDGGAAFCVAILAGSAVDDLVKRGLAAAQVSGPLVRIGVGVAYRKAGVKPDVATPDALMATLLTAKSVSVSDPALGGTSSVYYRTLIDRLGIADAMKDKTILTKPGAGATPVADGRADLGIVTMSEIASLPALDAEPLFPDDPKSQARFAVAVSAACKDNLEATAFVAYLHGPEARAAFAAKRINPD